MRLVRIAVIAAGCAGLFGATTATALATPLVGTFCDSPQSKSKMWAPLAQLYAQKASTVATPNVAAKNNNGYTPLLSSSGAGAATCCSPDGNDRNTASCAIYGPNTSYGLPVCTTGS